MDNLTRTSTLTGPTRGNILFAVVALVLVISIFCAAGFWQLQRASYKDDLKAKTEIAMQGAPVSLPVTRVSADDLAFHTVQVRGEWLASKTVYLDNKIRDRVVGYHVLTPLRIAASNMHVLVNRGWVAASPLRNELPEVTTPTGMVEVSGIARVPTDRFIELSSRVEEGRVWQNLTMDRYQAWSGLALQPVVIHQQNPTSDNLQRVAVAPEASGLGADRHRGYALTWFGLAAVTFLLAIAAKIRQKKT